MTPGEMLYRLHCGDPEGLTDHARYFACMNPAVKRHWEDLAARIIDDPIAVAAELRRAQAPR